jgi:outer membrane protein TolC
MSYSQTEADLIRENAQLRKEREELINLCGQAHSELDKLMGDSDLPDDDSQLMKLMQKLSAKLEGGK